MNTCDAKKFKQNSMSYLRVMWLLQRVGVDYLLDHQNADGTWGDYEAQRASMGDLVDQHLYLHTTVAATQALLETYERSPIPDSGR